MWGGGNATVEPGGVGLGTGQDDLGYGHPDER